MKITILATVLLGSTLAFIQNSSTPHVPSLYVGYVPEGLTADEYKRVKANDKSKLGKDLGRVGPIGFQSRSLQAWQKAYESNRAGHTFAPIGFKKLLKQKKIKLEDVPYMVRGGKWDNSDVKGAKNKLPWLKLDKDYVNGGYKKEQSVSILGSGPGFDWTGRGNKKTQGSIKRSFPGFS